MENFGIIVVVTRSRLFIMQKTQFVKAAKRTFASKLMGNDIKRLGLVEDLNDEWSYEGGQLERATWILGELWLSVVLVAKRQGGTMVAASTIETSTG